MGMGRGFRGWEWVEFSGWEWVESSEDGSEDGNG